MKSVESFHTDKVSVVGVGKLGASMVAGMASRGFDVVCVDVNPEVIDLVNQGQAPVQETGLNEMIANNSERIRATLDYKDAVLSSDITFVIVPTPSDDDGAFSTVFAEQAFEQIGSALRDKSSYHVIVLTSTVLPGATREVLLPILERYSGKRCGDDFGLCYSPEFIALGTVIRDFLNPDFYLVGEFDERSGEALEYINARVSLNKAKSKRMSIENAELAKIAINGYVTMKISYANMLSDMCEKIPGGDIDVVSDALGMDSRIGRKYLTGGFGFGGPCFPRDNVALAFIGERLGVDCSIPRANHQFNKQISLRAVHKLKSLLSGGETVSVLGLAYKPSSHVIDESPGVFLCRALADAGFKVVAHDPLANKLAKAELGDCASVVDKLDECLSRGSVIIFATPDPVYTELSVEEIVKGRSSLTIVDFWRSMFDKLANINAVRYVPVGRCTDDQLASEMLARVWKPK